jgi:hypothetical protein
MTPAAELVFSVVDRAVAAVVEAVRRVSHILIRW